MCQYQKIVTPYLTWKTEYNELNVNKNHNH